MDPPLLIGPIHRAYGRTANVLRLSSFGDSFTHGDDVRNEDTWQEVMNRSGPNLEVLNFGVPGFGLDQAFLRYQHDGIAYHSHIILIGFMPANIARNVSVFRPFLSLRTGLPLTKPYFTLDGNDLVLNHNPIQELSQYKEVL
ncbi:MAG: hypothetical protein ACE5JS_02985, partial [Nitrospinota bacterium]